MEEPVHTIAAISTPPGTGAVGMVRISGPDSFAVARDLFRGSLDSDAFLERRACTGSLYDGDTFLDRVVLTCYKGPRSYTGEDVVEICCHGGPMILENVLKALFRRGVEAAKPGEYTRRAFLNGKMDLLQAEGVEDMIRAENETALDAARKLLAGGVSKRFERLRAELVELLSGIEAEIEFPDEEDVSGRVEELAEKRLHRLRGILDFVEECRKGVDRGMLARQGFSAALFGAPNTGKSTLLNRLAGFERALVSKEPGTTRDYLCEKVDVEGRAVSFVDMAGIRADPAGIERMGIDHSRKVLEHATLALFVLDAARPLSEDDRLALETCPGELPRIWVLNKCDRPRGLSDDDPFLRGHETVRISALRGDGMDALKKAVARTIERCADPGKSEILLTRVRHGRCLDKCLAALERCRECIENASGLELAAFELNGALEALEELAGKVTPDEVLDTIFGSFCIGK
jgi:tRNA modification GTPase